MEHILQENKDRFVMFPLKYHDIWEMYKTQQHSFWTAEEIDLQQDLADWEKELLTGAPDEVAAEVPAIEVPVAE